MFAGAIGGPSKEGCSAFVTGTKISGSFFSVVPKDREMQSRSTASWTCDEMCRFVALNLFEGPRVQDPFGRMIMQRVLLLLQVDSNSIEYAQFVSI